MNKGNAKIRAKRTIIRRAGALLLLTIVLATSRPVLALPQMPGQFYGNVIINGRPAAPTMTISARINGVEYASTTTDSQGRYGYNPAFFMVPADDPETPVREGGNSSDTVQFYAGGALAGSAPFTLGQVTRLDLSVASPMPSVTTAPATSITATSAVLNGMLTSLGKAASVRVSFEYGTTTDYGNTTTSQIMTASGNFSANITDLVPATLYYFRAGAQGDVTGPSTGDDMTLTTMMVAAGKGPAPALTPPESEPNITTETNPDDVPERPLTASAPTISSPQTGAIEPTRNTDVPVIPKSGEVAPPKATKDSVPPSPGLSPRTDRDSKANSQSPSRLFGFDLASLLKLLAIILGSFAVMAAGAYFLLLRHPAKRVAATATAGNGTSQTAATRRRAKPVERPAKKRPLSSGVARSQGTKPETPATKRNPAPLKAIIDFARSLPLVEPTLVTRWPLDLLGNGAGISPAGEQLFKGDFQLHYGPAWLHHPAFPDLRSLLEGLPALEDLDTFVDSINRGTTEATSLLQDIYNDSIAGTPPGSLPKTGRAFIASVYADALNSFRSKPPSDPSDGDYSIKPHPDNAVGAPWLYGETATSFAGPLIPAADGQEAVKLRELHLKLRRKYRSTSKAKTVVDLIARLEAQRARLLYVFKQLERLNASDPPQAKPAS